MIDNRIVCNRDCREFAPDGRCRVAMRRSRLDVGRHYGPGQPDSPRRCEFFRPHEDAEDQTPGRKRFPELWAEYKARYGHLHTNWPKAAAAKEPAKEPA